MRRWNRFSPPAPPVEPSPVCDAGIARLGERVERMHDSGDVSFHRAVDAAVEHFASVLADYCAGRVGVETLHAIARAHDGRGEL